MYSRFCPSGTHVGSLYDLAGSLLARHKHMGAIEDRNEAIILYREVLVLRPPGDASHRRSFYLNLAGGLPHPVRIRERRVCVSFCRPYDYRR